MLVFVNLLALAVRFAIELALVCLGEVPVVSSHIFLLVVLQPLLASFQMRGLPRRQLVVLYAISNAVLLILFTAVYLGQ